MKRSRDTDDISRFLADESRLGGGAAEEVAWPSTVEEVSACLRDAHASGTPVTVSGAGTGVVGGRVPCGGLVLSMERMKEVLGFEKLGEGDAATLTVQPGLLLSEVHDHVAGLGWLYPPDPTETGSSIGGNIATNASGSRSFRYGPTRRWIRRLVVVLADGTVLDLPRGEIRAEGGEFVIPRDGAAPLVVPAPSWPAPATSKHVAGYHSEEAMDLVDLFIGEEGTLGVIAEADLALVPAPEEVFTGILFFPSEDAAFGFVDRARDAGGGTIDPLALEYFGPAALDLLRANGVSLPDDARVAILFEQGSATREMPALADAWIELASAHDVSEESWIAQGPSDHRRFREFRHQIPVSINETLARRGVRKLSTDTSVPRGALPDMLAAFRRELEGAGLEYVEFGHVGNDHLHVNVIPKDPSQESAAREVYARLIDAAIELGGSVSGEHGLGKTKAAYLRKQYPAEVIERMIAIKRALDPKLQLGRGTLFDRLAAGAAS
jgi:D-lactate dehydrogenase (cytochrome)